jgi:hypothetical protein
MMTLKLLLLICSYFLFFLELGEAARFTKRKAINIFTLYLEDLK